MGRRGLMPNPRTGTVVQPDDLPRVISDSKKGRVEYRLDRTGLMHLAIGKASFDERHLLENLSSIMDNITHSRPSGVKGQFIIAAYLASTMGPGIALDVAALTTITVE